MYIHRVIIRGLKGSPNRDLTLFNDWTQEPLRSILITGPNGSGKTTLLRVIATLWEDLGVWLQTRQPRQQPSFLDKAEFVALEIREWDPLGSVWVYRAKDHDIAKTIFEEFKINPDIKIGQAQHLHDWERSKLLIERSTDWIDEVSTQYNRITLGQPGVSHNLPNMIYLDAEERQVYAPNANELNTISPEPYFRWLATYKPSSGAEGNLEVMLRNLKVRDPQWFQETVNGINQFLGEDKKITDFDENLRLQVRVGESDVHYLEYLSSGERQAALLMFMVQRWLMKGSIVLIDEPDLHLHVSLQRHFIREVEKVVERQHGQLIVTSHSPKLWEEYNHHQRFTFGWEEWQGDRLAN